jgi:hypothetical protein
MPRKKGKFNGNFKIENMWRRDWKYAPLDWLNFLIDGAGDFCVFLAKS